MKNLMSSDINPMVLYTMNNVAIGAAIRLDLPVNTVVTWGRDVFPGGDSAVWGTSAAQGASWIPPSSAVWGTRPFRAPMQQMWTQRHSGIEWVN
jgi:hypothetical protein